MNQSRFQPRAVWFLIPVMLMLLGSLITAYQELQSVNLVVRETAVGLTQGWHTQVDNFLQYLPLLMFLLIPGELRWWERVLLGLVCILVLQGFTESIKHTTLVLRPDASTPNSFPSGHTGTSFVNATLLAVYCRKRPAVGTFGYLVALSVGCLRILNNRHWTSDVLFGAGLGICVVLVIYWLYCKLTKKEE